MWALGGFREMVAPVSSGRTRHNRTPSEILFPAHWPRVRTPFYYTIILAQMKNRTSSLYLATSVTTAIKAITRIDAYPLVDSYCWKGSFLGDLKSIHTLPVAQRLTGAPTTQPMDIDFGRWHAINAPNFSSGSISTIVCPLKDAFTLDASRTISMLYLHRQGGIHIPYTSGMFRS